MKTALRSTCHSCNAKLLIPVHRVFLDMSEPRIYFDCPYCDTTQHHTNLSDDIIMTVFRAYGVHVVFNPTGKDLETKPSSLPPLTYDSIIDFHFELANAQSISLTR